MPIAVCTNVLKLRTRIAIAKYLDEVADRAMSAAPRHAASLQSKRWAVRCRKDRPIRLTVLEELASTPIPASSPAPGRATSDS